MTPLKKILEVEANGGEQVIHLHRSGIFLSAYNRSAVLLLKHCEVNFKPNYKFSKELGKEFASVGFPATSLDKLFPANINDVHTEETGYRVVTDCTATDEEVEEFIRRSKEVASQPPAKGGGVGSREMRSKEEPPPKGRSGAEPEVLERLRRFDLAHATPVECLLFVEQLKVAINN